MITTIKKATSCANVLTKLLEQRKEFPVKTCFKLYKTINILNEVIDFVIFTMNSVYGKDFDMSNLTEEQMFYYTSLSQCEIDINVDLFTIEELSGNGNPILNIDDINSLSLIVQQS